MMQHPFALLLQHVNHCTQCDEMSGVHAIFIAKFKHWLAARGLPLIHDHNNDVTEYQHSFVVYKGSCKDHRNQQKHPTPFPVLFLVEITGET